MGKEGRAAVRSADFAFAKFRFVKKVLLVHGHWFYYRVALLVHYFFYKNVACFAGILFYCFYNNFSIQPLYDSINLTFYNIFWTSAPIFVFALLEQNLSKKQLMRNPVFYRRIRQNRMMRRREFFLWFCTALWHGVVIFFGWLLFWSSSPSGLGLTSNITNSEQLDQFSFGLCVYSSAVVLVNLKLWFQVVLINTGVLNWFGGTYDTDQQPRAPMDPNTFHVYLHTLAAPGVWLFTLVSLVAAL